MNQCYFGGKTLYSCGHYTTSFGKNVIVTKTANKTLEILSFLRSGEGLTSFNYNNRANVYDKKKDDETFGGVYFLTISEKS